MSELLQPLYDRILVAPSKGTDMSAGGIYTPQGKDDPLRGTVLSVGSGRLFSDGSTCPLKVKVGDQVMFGPRAGAVITLGGQKRIIMREDDVLGVVHKSE